MFDAQTAEPFGEETMADEPSRRPRLRLARSEPAAEMAYAPSHYAPSNRRSLIPFVIGAHLILLWAVVHFDVHHRHHRHHRLEVNLVPLDTPPPPQAPPPPNPQPVKVQTPVVAPPPIVQPAIAVPQPVLAAPLAVKVAPVASAAPAVAAAIVSEAAPIMPPDGFAANLGNIPPRYPMESRRAREEGTVRLRVLISPQGTVEDVKVATSSGFDRLDDVALQAVRKWRFRPGTQAGTPVEAVGFLSIPFKLTR